MVFKCGQCGDFETDDFEEMLDHKASKSHVYNGIAPCNNCGKENKYKFKGILEKGKTPSLCKDCALKIVEGQDE